jgi:hypothetical protein
MSTAIIINPSVVRILFINPSPFWLKQNAAITEKEKPKTKVKRLVVVLLLFFAITIIAGIVIPSIPIYRPESYCRRVESEAAEIKAALSDYFSNPAHNDINMKPEALADMEYIKNPTKYLCEYAART